MDAISQLLNGFAGAISLVNLAMAFVGAVLGTLVGVLPGLAPASTIAILIPVTTVLNPTTAIIMMAGIYYGAQYGGSTAAILLNIPGEVSSVPTTLDGYQLARKGLGGPALGIAAIASFVAGTLSMVGLTFFMPVLANLAIHFGPPEYFAVMILSMTVIVGLSGESLLKGLIMAMFGFWLSMFGIGQMSGMPRFAFGTILLSGGFDIVAMVIGVFAVAEVLESLGSDIGSISEMKIGRVLPTWRELRQCAPAILRGTLGGFGLGLLPGCSPGVTTFLVYDWEKRLAKDPSRFGKGAIEGVAAPEAANNATAQAGFIPLLALGIPTSAALAVLFGALVIYGLQPGPLLFEKNPQFVWVVIASMYIGNVFLLVLNLPLVGLWVRLTRVPYGLLAPIVLALCLIGAYSTRNSLFDLTVVLIFGVIGYFMRRYHWPASPLVLSFLLGPLFEKSVLQSLAMSAGKFSIFVTRPASLVILVAAAVLLAFSLRVRLVAARLKPPKSS